MEYCGRKRSHTIININKTIKKTLYVVFRHSQWEPDLEEALAEVEETSVALPEADMVSLHSLLLESCHHHLLQFLGHTKHNYVIRIT